MKCYFVNNHNHKKTVFSQFFLGITILILVHKINIYVIMKFLKLIIIIIQNFYIYICKI